MFYKCSLEIMILTDLSWTIANKFKVYVKLDYNRLYH